MLRSVKRFCSRFVGKSNPVFYNFTARDSIRCFTQVSVLQFVLPINTVLMIRRLLFTCWLIAGCLSTGLAQRQCATTAYDSLLRLRHLGWAQSRVKLETLIQQKRVNGQNFRVEEEETIRIPVVVHVVHHDLKNIDNPGASGSG